MGQKPPKFTKIGPNSLKMKICRANGLVTMVNPKEIIQNGSIPSDLTPHSSPPQTTLEWVVSVQKYRGRDKSDTNKTDLEYILTGKSFVPGVLYGA